MSRIPPASVRVTSGTLDFLSVGTSLYYFRSQLKNNIAFDRAIKKLKKNLGFSTSVSKKKRTLPQLILSTFPVYTQLRAKKYYDLLLSRSHHWFMGKLFRGAQSRSLTYLYAVANQKKHEEFTNIDSSANALQLICTALFFNPSKGSGKSPSLVLKTPLTNLKSSTLPNVNFLKHKVSHVDKKQPMNFQSAQRADVINKHNQFAESKKPRVDAFGPTTMGWSKAALFSLFCINQVISKQRSIKSKNLVSLQNASLNDSFDSRKPFRTKKRYQKPYDYLFIKQLEQNQCLQIRNGYGVPKSTVRNLKRDFSLNKAFTEVVATLTKKGTTDAKARQAEFKNKQKRRQKQSANANYGYKLNEKFVGLRLDNLTRHIKNNVNPKFWVNRTFHKNAQLNVLSFIEGRINAGHQQGFQKHMMQFHKQRNSANVKPVALDANALSVYKIPGYQSCHSDACFIVPAGLQRFKTGFVFELGLSPVTESKSLRPTLSMRF